MTLPPRREGCSLFTCRIKTAPTFGLKKATDPGNIHKKQKGKGGAKELSKTAGYAKKGALK